MNTKLLITGGTGLLGSYMIRWFRQKGYPYITATCQGSVGNVPDHLREGIRWEQVSLPDQEKTLAIIAGQEVVIHTAGMVSYRKKDQFKLLDINQTGTEHIVNACLAHAVSHLIYIGSIAALGKEQDQVTLTETSPWLDTSYSTAYGLSKYLGELEVWRGAAEGLPVSVVLPSVIVGAGDWQRSSLQIFDQVKYKLPFYPGGQTGFVDVRDVVRFVDILINRSLTGERWIINGANMTYRDMYAMIAHEIGLRKKFRLAPKWLAHIVLRLQNLVKDSTLGTQALHQVYGTFTYDASKSMSLTGMTYRDLGDTIREVVDVYEKRSLQGVLPF